MKTIMTQEIILTIGLPASGKTTWTNEQIKQNPDYVNVNRDDIRLMLQGRERYAKFSRWREDVVTETAFSMARASLNEGKSVIVSDTNLNPKLRNQWKEFAQARDVNYREVLFTDVPYGVCIHRDARREHPVGAKVIIGMYERYKDEFWPVPVYNSDLPDAYVFDVDGTVAKMNGRSPFAWDKVNTDLPKTNVIDVIKALAKTNATIIGVSGRDGSCKEMTQQWLSTYGVPYDEFYIRPAGDNRKDYYIKEEIYRNHIEGRFNVLGVFDDRDQVVHMWRQLGITVFQVDYGDF